MTARLDDLAEELQRHLAPDSGALLLVTGAGISAASGIPTFRGADPGAVWRESDVRIATRETFESDPLRQWLWYLQRFESLDGAAPNEAHLAVAALEELYRRASRPFTLVTQNIDTLHERGGSARPIKIHGTSDRLRCSRDGCRFGAPRGSLARSGVDLRPLGEVRSRDAIPRCPDCGALLRAHVLLFDEYYGDHEDYRYDEALLAAENAASMLFVGTSFAVGITDLLLRVAQRTGAPCLSIDPALHRHPNGFDVRHLKAAAEEILPVVVARLEADR